MTSQSKMVVTSPINYLEALHDARRHTLLLVADLTNEQLLGPRLPIVNPLLWEIGHVAWFQEYWVLRQLNGRPPVLENGDALYDSAKVSHNTRWDLPLLSHTQTMNYMREVLERITDLYQDTKELDDEAKYFLSLALFHEDMHDEAFGYTRQTLGYPKPRFDEADSPPTRHQVASDQNLGDAQISGGQFLLGSIPDRPFVFDNEMTAHMVEVQPFAISRTAVTNGEFAAFVDDGGYAREEFWSVAGWLWRQSVNATHPVYWLREDNQWLRREFDRLVPLHPQLPVLHVNWFEADAFCRWAKRRLPSEVEWEMAASLALNSNGNENKRRFPWGEEPATPTRANLDWQAGGCIDVSALRESDSSSGCRQMIGNVWEWSATDFNPYVGFKAGPYKEYSAPWFGDHKVLRGGCWATRSRLIHNSYRNFYKPDRRDVWAGFRTCAV